VRDGGATSLAVGLVRVWRVVPCGRTYLDCCLVPEKGGWQRWASREASEERRLSPMRVAGRWPSGLKDPWPAPGVLLRPDIMLDMSTDS
jgi:hypothetical protein